MKEGLCQSCKEWVVPEVVDNARFCPICGQNFIDIHDKEIDIAQYENEEPDDCLTSYEQEEHCGDSQ